MKFELYKSKDGWRWRFKARNGEIIAVSSEAYAAKDSAMYSIGLVAGGTPSASITEVDS